MRGKGAWRSRGMIVDFVQHRKAVLLGKPNRKDTPTVVSLRIPDRHFCLYESLLSPTFFSSTKSVCFPLTSSFNCRCKSNNPLSFLSMPPLPPQSRVSAKSPKPTLHIPLLPTLLTDLIPKVLKTLCIMLPDIAFMFCRTLHIRALPLLRVQMSRHPPCLHHAKSIS